MLEALILVTKTKLSKLNLPEVRFPPLNQGITRSETKLSVLDIRTKRSHCYATGYFIYTQTSRHSSATPDFFFLSFSPFGRHQHHMTIFAMFAESLRHHIESTLVCQKERDEYACRQLRFPYYAGGTVRLNS